MPDFLVVLTRDDNTVQLENAKVTVDAETVMIDDVMRAIEPRIKELEGQLGVKVLPAVIATPTGEMLWWDAHAL